MYNVRMTNRADVYRHLWEIMNKQATGVLIFVPKARQRLKLHVNWTSIFASHYATGKASKNP